MYLPTIAPLPRWRSERSDRRPPSCFRHPQCASSVGSFLHRCLNLIALRGRESQLQTVPSARATSGRDLHRRSAMACLKAMLPRSGGPRSGGSLSAEMKPGRIATAGGVDAGGTAEGEARDVVSGSGGRAFLASDGATDRGTGRGEAITLTGSCSTLPQAESDRPIARKTASRITAAVSSRCPAEPLRRHRRCRFRTTRPHANSRRCTQLLSCRR